MDIKETQLDMEAVESATNEINYYANLPKHIRGIVSEMKDIKSNTDMPKPAHVVNGAVTVIGGKLNMPDLKYSKQFTKRTSFFNGIS